jgi:hypothetical protein
MAMMAHKKKRNGIIHDSNRFKKNKQQKPYLQLATLTTRSHPAGA